MLPSSYLKRDEEGEMEGREREEDDGGRGGDEKEGVENGGVGDSGVVDSGEVDSGEVDSGEVDSGEVDSGEVDSGEVDPHKVEVAKQMAVVQYHRVSVLPYSIHVMLHVRCIVY